MTGSLYTDQVCLPSANICVDDYKFLGVESLDSLVPEEVANFGAIGLAPGRYDGSEESMHIVKAMKNAQLIDKEVATLHFTDDKQDSQVIFGSMPDNLIDGQSFTLQAKENSKPWELGLEFVYYGDTPLFLRTSGLTVGQFVAAIEGISLPADAY